MVMCSSLRQVAVRGLRARMYGLLSLAWVAMLCGPAAAAPATIGQLQTYEGPDYVIFSNYPEHRVRSVTRGLAQFTRLLEEMLRQKAVSTGFKTRIYLVSGAIWKDYLQPRHSIGGYFAPRPFNNYMVIDGSYGLEDALGIVFHEYTHYFMATQFPRDYPAWFNEGIAEMMSTVAFRGDSATLKVPVGRVLDVRNSPWIPFERLVKVSEGSPEYVEHRLARGFYGQAWISVQYGWIENPPFWSMTVRYLDALHRGESIDAAVERGYGMSYADIDALLYKYSRGISMPQGRITIGEVDSPPMRPGALLSESETMAEVSRLMLERRDSPEQALALANRAEKLDPGAAHVLLAKAYAAERMKDTVTADALIGKLENGIADGNWSAARDLGLLLLDRVQGPHAMELPAEQSAAIAQRAYRLLDRSVRANPDDPEATWAFAQAALMLDGDLDLAWSRAKNVHPLTPRSAHLAKTLAELHRRQGEFDQMMRYLADTARYATHAAMREWALERIKEYEQGKMSAAGATD